MAVALGIGAFLTISIVGISVYYGCKRMRSKMRSQLRAAQVTMFEVGKQAGTNVTLQISSSMRTGWCLSRMCTYWCLVCNGDWCSYMLRPLINWSHYYYYTVLKIGVLVLRICLFAYRATGSVEWHWWGCGESTASVATIPRQPEKIIPNFKLSRDMWV